MNGFVLSEMRNPSPWGLYRMREQLNLAPPYQREGGIWTEENRQLLIDTILNRFDVPKLYVHGFTKPQLSNGHQIEYAVIDGRQRLETLFAFIEGEFALSNEFKFLHDDSINAAGFTYSDLAREYPDLKADFDSASLDVVVIQTDDLELIEEMFSRLNEAVPLNAAEKRNALPGPLPSAVRELTTGEFWTKNLPFANKRYRHYDLAAKMLYIESRSTVPDTKKSYVDKFFEEHGVSNRADIQPLLDRSVSATAQMAKVFTTADPLLRSVGMVILYYQLFKRAIQLNRGGLITRPALAEFERKREENRKVAEYDITEANYHLLEFDRFAQSLNDAIAMRFRLSVLDSVLFNGKLGFHLPESGA